MRYYVFYMNEAFAPFLTNYFDPENHWDEKRGMIVYDLHKKRYMVDEPVWKDVEYDNL